VPSPSELIRGSGLPRHEAERLLVVATGRSRTELVTAEPIGGDAAARFRQLVAERHRGVPLQYLEGTVQFGRLELMSDARALIPRPETERLWELVVAELECDEPQVIIDLCTGSGNLALAMKDAFPAAAVYGTDISADAIALAEQNGARTGLEVTWLEGDLFDSLPAGLRGGVDLVVANPPYVAAADFDTLPAEVREHEPVGALVAGPGGDEVLARIASRARDWLRLGGLIVCELGLGQGERARELFAEYEPTIVADLTGRERFVFGRRRRD
jgi:release factor glutamine methyltransferase